MEESHARAGYGQISRGEKHKPQTNVRPILNWNAAEIFMYLLARDIFFNQAYRNGISRVGCSVCPFGSLWGEFVLGERYADDITNFLQILAEQRESAQIGIHSLNKFIADGQWKVRGGGTTLVGITDKVSAFEQNGQMVFSISNPKEDWIEWAKTLGTICILSENLGIITIKGVEYPFEINRSDGHLQITVKNTKDADRFLRSHFKILANKVAYCVQCHGCVVECPTGALQANNGVEIDPNVCNHCGNCLTFAEKGCLAAKSLKFNKGGSPMKGLDRYCTFGLRKEWLQEFFYDPELWWRQNNLGPKQFVGMRAWLKEAELSDVMPESKLSSKLRKLGTDNILTWAVIWTNLARNSNLVAWYVTNTSWCKDYNRRDLIEILSNGIPKRTHENALAALIGLLKATPLGTIMGLGDVNAADRRNLIIRRVGWDDPVPTAILYSLYRYAERLKRHNLTIHELLNGALEGPYTLFGVPENQLIRILRGISANHESWISVEAVRDLDNIYLDSSRRSQDVLDLQ